MTGLPDLRIANGISSNGSIVVGYQEVPGSVEARAWSQAGGVQTFAPFPGTPFNHVTSSRGNGASADGSVVVGSITYQLTSGPNAVFSSTGFIWDAVHGSRTMPLPNGTLPRTGPTDITPDGMVVCGLLATSGPNQLFRWTEADGYQFFQFGGGMFGKPAISADGNAIVTGLNYWSPGTGVITIQQLLSNAGCDFTDWTLTGAVGISDDGRTIAGNGINPAGQTEAWIAIIPAPFSAIPIVGFGATALFRRRR